MFAITYKEDLAKDITKITVQAEQIARKACAGQFVVIIVDEKGERIPLTLADWDKDKGTISLIFQKVGFTTRKLGTLKVGDNIAHILGPLGHPTKTRDIGEATDAGETKDIRTVICIGGGVGIAEVYPVARAFKQAGSQVLGIIGSRSKDLLFLEDEMRKVCDELFVTTDDGSYGQKGFVTDVLKAILSQKTKQRLNETTIKRNNESTDLVYAIGPVVMMQAVSDLTRGYKIKTMVSLNPVMVDATGMCGSCRCHVGGKTVFGCVDGPDFDGHQVDFAELKNRLDLFKQEERLINEKSVA